MHVPLSPEAQVGSVPVDALLAEHPLTRARRATAVPTQDMVLGIYYLTKPHVVKPDVKQSFASIEEVLLAHESGRVSTLTPIQLRYTGELLETHDGQDLRR